MHDSNDLFARAQRHIPGGVNSPVRAFRGVGGDPVFVQRALGSRLYDIEGREFIDYVGSWGPMILGHAHPEVLAAVERTMRNGLSFGAPTALEVDVAERVCALVPAMEQVRMVNSGTEATMSALRLARAATGRDLVIKFDGCYHGHADSFLVQAGSGALTLGVPNSPGVPAELARLTLSIPYNDIDAFKRTMAEHGERCAAVIVEPVAGNMNLVPPVPGFLEALRDTCDQTGALLIFDEVMTGFRVALGGAQARYGVDPDLSTFGKIIGGGMPVGAFGGRTQWMSQIAPVGPVYQAGTLSGNPVAMAAGLRTLELIAEPGFHERLEAATQRLCHGLEAAANAAGVPFMTQAVGGMFGFFFTDRAVVTSITDIDEHGVEQFRRFFHEMLQRGIYLAPSAYEAGFMSSAHSDADIQRTVECAAESFAAMTS